MAIEKVYFNISTAVNNANAVSAWLLENAADYVDDVVIDDNESWKRVRLYYGEFEYLSFTYGTSTSVKNTLCAYSQNGASSTGSSSDADVGMVQFAYKTSCGIFLYFNSSHIIMLSKTDDDSIAVYSRWQKREMPSASWVTTNICKMFDVKNSASVYTDYIPSVVLSRDKTTLVPMFFNGGTSTPDMLLMTCSQHRGSIGIIIANDVKYVTDGYVALRE